MQKTKNFWSRPLVQNVSGFPRLVLTFSVPDPHRARINPLTTMKRTLLANPENPR